MRRVWIIVVSVAAMTVAVGFALPMLARPSNCGGNSAALSACRNVSLAVRIISSDRGTNLADLSRLTSEELREFQNIPGMSWLHGAHLLVRTNGFALGPGEVKGIIVVCDTAYSNVPQYRFRQAPATHAVGYSDGTVGLLRPAEFHSLDLSRFQDINHFARKSKVEPVAGPNSR